MSLRLRMKVWTDPISGLQWLCPMAFKPYPDRPLWSVYVMRDNSATLHSMTDEQWNALPYYWFDMGPEAETRPGSKPWDMVK